MSKSKSSKLNVTLSIRDGESRTLLQVIYREMFNAGMIAADDLLYGSNQTFSKSDKEYKGLERVFQSIPEHVRNAYAAELRHEQAEKLRAKADALERGEKDA